MARRWITWTPWPRVLLLANVMPSWDGAHSKWPCNILYIVSMSVCCLRRCREDSIQMLKMLTVAECSQPADHFNEFFAAHILSLQYHVAELDETMVLMNHRYKIASLSINFTLSELTLKCSFKNQTKAVI
jgi:hypothetical protein